MSKDLIKHVLKSLTAVALLGTCFYYLDLGRVLEVMVQTGVETYALAFVITLFGTIVLPAVVTQKSLIISSISIPLNRLIQINLAVRFYMLVLPRAVAVAIRWYRYQEAGSGYDAAALMGFERIVQLLVVTLMSAVFLYIDLDTAGTQGLPLLAVSSVVALGFLVLLFLYVSKGFAGFIERYFMGWLRFLPDGLARRIDKLWASINAFHAIPKTVILQLIAISILGYVLFILSAWILASGMGMDISLASLIWIRSIVFFITLIPISIGGIGVREVGFIYFLSFAGVTEENAFAFSLAMLAVQLVIGLVGALLEAQRLLQNKPIKPQ